MKKASLMIMAILILLAAGCGGSDGASRNGGPSDTGPSDSGDILPPSITVVLASDVTETTAAITWTTDEPATSQVEYGMTSAYGSSSALDAYLTTSHSVTLSGLTQGTTYHYRAKSKDASGNQNMSVDSEFTTLQGAIEITAAQLLSEYVANEIAADNAYEGQILRVSGIIIDIGNDYAGRPYIELGSGNELWGVKCRFDSAAGLAQLSKGQSCYSEGGMHRLST